MRANVAESPINKPFSASPLRPAFGSGEDWNRVEVLCLRRISLLRPAFGSGEDWNSYGAEIVNSFPKLLRPAFGSGEDWNEGGLVALDRLDELRPAFGSGEDWNASGTW